MPPWWELYPKRYESEIDRLEQLGLTYRIDESAKTAGRLVITIDYPYEGGTTPLIAKFPGSYPYFRFNVEAPHLELPRHRNYFNGGLCLITQGTDQWYIDDHLADFIRDRIPLVIKVANDKHSDFAAAHEEHTGDPIKPYIHTMPMASVLLERWVIPGTETSGLLEVGYELQRPFRGAVVSLQTTGKSVIGELPSEVAGHFKERCRGRWIRLPSRPMTMNVIELVALAESIVPGCTKPDFHHGPYILGLVYEDEVEWRGNGDDWLFIVFYKVREHRKPTQIQYELVVSDYVGHEDLLQRVPELRPLAGKTVLLAGAGSLGSSIAIHLARAGVGELRIIDNDIVSVGNTVRWALGWQSRQMPKVQALRNYLTSSYPYVRVRGIQLRIGEVLTPDLPTDRDILEDALDGVDLVIDATAEWGVRHFLSDLAHDRRLPFVWAVATPGLWGGIVGRVRPGKTKGCLHCYDYGMANDWYRSPIQRDNSDVQVIGCSAPTFTGAGIDSEEVAVLGARLAISTLCEGVNGSYPQFEWDIAVLDLRRPDGMAITPKWDSFEIKLHHECCRCC